MQLKERDEKCIGRGGDATDIEVVKTQGSHIIAKSGKQYIDFLTGWCVGNIGWHNPYVRDRLKNFDGPEYVNPGFLYEPWVQLAELLAKITPGELAVSYRATGGTEAVEIALQAAMSHTKKTHFISIDNAYHGHSIGAMSIGENMFQAHYTNLLPHCHRLKTPLDDYAVLALEKLLKNNPVAAFIMEPIICNLGVEIPTQSFMKNAAELCKKYGALFIMDEVACGFYRTGKLFASEHFDIQPDILCMAKGITGGYGALGATIMTKEVAQSMDFDFSFYSTFGWHPIATEAALANLHFMLENKDNIEKNIHAMHDYFVTRLSAMQFKSPAKIYAIGLAIGITFDDARYARKVVVAAREAGVIVSTASRGSVVFFPAITIDKDTAKAGLDIIESILN
jgi:acetylornithine/succinyldiaminopimelate/putrescine aminotransferase